MPQRGFRLPSGEPIRTGTVYDALTTRYTFACPARGESHVCLSSFRELERLPGAAHPAVYRVRFSCACGDDPEVVVVAHVLAEAAIHTLDSFCAELYSTSFDARRLDLQ